MPDGGKKTVQEFAKQVKSQYPAYADYDDDKLVNAILEKYPVYREQIDFSKKKEPFLGFYSPDGKSGYSPLLSSGKEIRPLSQNELQEQGYGTVPQTQGNYIPKSPVEDFYDQAGHAQKRLMGAILDNKDVMASSIKNMKIENQRQQKLTGVILNNKSDATAVNKGLNLSQFQPPQEKIDASPLEVDEALMETIHDGDKAEKHLQKIGQAKPDQQARINEDLYRVNVAARNTPLDETKLRNDIIPAINGIREGKVIYKNGRLYEPQGPVDYFFSSRENMKNTLDKYHFLTSTDNLASIASTYEDERIHDNPDKINPVPKGFLSETLGGFGGLPLSATLGGAGVGLAVGLVPGAEGAAPAAGKIAGSIFGGKAMHDIEFANEFQRAFNEFRNQDIDPMEAARKSMPLAVEAGRVGAAEGAALGFVGGKAPAAGKEVLTQSLKRTAAHFLKTGIPESLGTGALMGLGQLYKNYEARQAGIDRPLDADVMDQAMAMAKLTLMVKGAGLGMGVMLDPKTYKSVVRELPKVDPQHVNEAIAELAATGQLKPEQTQAVADEINKQAEKLATIPDDVSDRNKNKILDLKEERDELKAQLETQDEAFHKGIKDKINGVKGKDGAPDKKGINEKIVELSNDKRPPTELENLIDKHEDKLGAYKKGANDNPEAFFKEVADQAFGRQSDGSISPLPEAEKAIREQFGNEIVDKAKELFPMDTKKVESKSVPIENDLFDHDISDKKDEQVKLTVNDSKGEPRDVFAKAGEIQRRLKNRHQNLSDILNCLTK